MEGNNGERSFLEISEDGLNEAIYHFCKRLRLNAHSATDILAFFWRYRDQQIEKRLNWVNLEDEYSRRS